MIELSGHMTKIVCTIGPASRSEAVLEELMKNGMDVARLNFAHGSLEDHREVIGRIRAIAAKLHRGCMILGDLPGPKIRIGKLQNQPLLLNKEDEISLTTEDVPGTAARIPVGYPKLPQSVSAGRTIYLNDGFIQLQVQEVSGFDVRCKVVIGGELLSYKGLNIPGAKIDLDVITEQDLGFVDFGLREGIDAFSISFVEKAADILKVRAFAKERGESLYVVAKIERVEAIDRIDEILNAADAVMIARGDLGVQIPLEDVPAVQKKLIHKANLMNRPVITATQMLVSMTQNVRPTRAEVSDAANAILDGTDAVMLSEETAVGKYPAEAVAMLAKIAASIERQREEIDALSDLAEYFRKGPGREGISAEETISLNAIETARSLNARYILVPTQNGDAARRLSRFKPGCWILSFCDDEKTRNLLALSFGVLPVLMKREERGDPDAVKRYLIDAGLSQKNDRLILTQRATAGRPDDIDSLRVLTI
ncbi:pyruvate kinase [Candidatus Manganitrophus noduliformans]|uniref:pyruvate kinase n=1 Tax=Candidatus Manganitrophus noduliformans TaxID=2606439 RepID=UPI0015E34A49|nr:pyruvate kinase [Candidatus Manganitrophus noduliformans]